MKTSALNISENIQFRLFLISTIVLLVYKLFFSVPGSLVHMIISDILILLTVTFLFLSLLFYFEKRKASPFSLIMNIGILNAFIFFMITFSDSFMSLFFDDANERAADPNIFSILVMLVYLLVIVGFITYVIVTLRHLFFLRQSNTQQVYFVTMLVFFILASLTAPYLNDTKLAFICDTFLIVSVLLMVINSLRISWIAFIVKKEKIALLVLSIVIAVLFIVNLNNSGKGTLHSNMLVSFAPSVSEYANIVMLYGAIYFSVLFFTTLFHIPTAEAFDRKAEEVSSLQYFSKLITQVLDFNELAETVTDITIRVGSADASWIIWRNDEAVPIANKNIGFVDSEHISNFILKKIKWDEIKESIFLKLNELEKSNELSQPYRIAAVSPLKSHDDVKGLLVAVRKGDKKFNEEDKSAIATFSDYASVSIENSRLLEESIEKERLEKELDVAREIQKKILPEKNPEYDELEISSVFIPAFEVGGDYYDFFELSKSKLGFVIADVSGKGISAAFIMAEVKGIFESLAKTFLSPKEILVRANDILKHTLDKRTFVSAAYGVIDLENNQMKLARAGHCPVLLLRDNTAQPVKPLGIGLGLSDEKHFEENLEELTLKMQENDTIVLYTDGITEAKNENLEDFGEKYFTEILLENNKKSVDEISKKVIKEVSMFSQNQLQYDDITLVILKWKQKIKIDGEKEWQSSAPQL